MNQCPTSATNAASSQAKSLAVKVVRFAIRVEPGGMSQVAERQSLVQGSFQDVGINQAREEKSINFDNFTSRFDMIYSINLCACEQGM